VTTYYLLETVVSSIWELPLPYNTSFPPFPIPFRRPSVYSWILPLHQPSLSQVTIGTCPDISGSLLYIISLSSRITYSRCPYICSSPFWVICISYKCLNPGKCLQIAVITSSKASLVFRQAIRAFKDPNHGIHCHKSHSESQYGVYTLVQAYGPMLSFVESHDQPS